MTRSTILIAPILLSVFSLLAQNTPAPRHAPRYPTPTPAPAPSPSTVWKPALNTSWQWQLTTPVDLTQNVAMYDIDLFDNDANVVAAIHAKGAKAVCYLDAGTWENWRPDASKFPSSVQGRTNGWPGEKWLDIRQISVLAPIMEARLDICKAKGFDGVEFDNVDGYSNSTGFPLSYQDQIAYNTFLAQQAHARGISAALKNDVDQIPDLWQAFDWAVDEQCFQYHECSNLQSFFVVNNKAVFEVEYSLSTSSFCPQANSMNFNSMKKKLSLDAYRAPCR